MAQPGAAVLVEPLGSCTSRLPASRATEGSSELLAGALVHTSIAAKKSLKKVCRPAVRAAEAAMGLRNSLAVWVSSSLGTHSPQQIPSSNVLHAYIPPERVPVDLKLFTGEDRRLYMDANLSVLQLKEHMKQAAGILPLHQTIVIAEDRARSSGLTDIARSMQKSMRDVRLDLRAALIAWINFVFVPEIFNRELYGRGVISWAKATGWYQSLQEGKAAMSVKSNEALSQTVKIQVEHLSGKVSLLEVEAAVTVMEIRSAVQLRFGILKEQQRVIVVERHGPGRLTNLGNAILLHSFAGLKCAFEALSSVGSSLLSKHGAKFPILVQTSMGKTATLTVDGDTTLWQIRGLLDCHGPETAGYIQSIKFPAQLPALWHTPLDSHIIKAGSV